MQILTKSKDVIGRHPQLRMPLTKQGKIFYLNEPNPTSFCLFLFFSHGKNSTI